MTVVETLLVYAAAPLAIILLLVVLNLRGAHRRPRYRPGQPWNHPPVWYEPHPGGSQPGHGAGSGHGELEVGHSGYAEVDRAGAGPVLGSGPNAPSAHPGGPLGGARGTW